MIHAVQVGMIQVGMVQVGMIHLLLHHKAAEQMNISDITWVEPVTEPLLAEYIKGAQSVEMVINAPDVCG